MSTANDLVFISEILNFSVSSEHLCSFDLHGFLRPNIAPSLSLLPHILKESARSDNKSRATHRASALTLSRSRRRLFATYFDPIPPRSPSDPWIHASAWLSFAPTLSPLPNKHIFTSHLSISLKWQVKGFRVFAHMKRADAFPQFTATPWLQNNRTLSRVRILRGKAPSVCPNTPLQTLSAGAASLSRRTDRSALTLSVRERREAAQWGMLLWWAGGESERLSGSEQIWGAAEYKPLPLGWRRERTRVLGFSLV